MSSALNVVGMATDPRLGSAKPSAEMCRVLDELFANGTTDISQLYEVMKETKRHLLIKNKKGDLIDLPRMKRLWAKYRKNSE